MLRSCKDVRIHVHEIWNCARKWRVIPLIFPIYLGQVKLALGLGAMLKISNGKC